jgi:DegV family protein with EDD domain
MQIVTDRGCDISAEQMADLNIHFAPMRLTLDGKTYSSGEDLSSEEFYDLLETTESLPVTSQATAGDFAKIYTKLAETDPEILSIHISTGLSGTYNSAVAGAEMAPTAHVTHWDTMTLSCPEAWQVEAAAHAIQMGWPIKDILGLLSRIRDGAEGIYTVENLRYLIHGGRISHIQGLLASLLQIRPVIAIGKEDGKYYTVAKERTTHRALQKMAQSITNFYPEGTILRTQLLHGKNFEAIAIIKEEMEKLFECVWAPTMRVGPILGAHTGGSLAGMCIGPMAVMEEVLAPSMAQVA